MHRDTLYRYQNYLVFITHLKSLGKTTVTSEDMAARVGVTASRVRQDMMALRLTGRPHAGYRITDMEMLIYSMLDLLAPKPMALVGVGKLGSSLAQRDIWAHTGFELMALFDSDPCLVGTIVADIPIRHTTDMIETIGRQGIVAACITVPNEQAQNAANLLVTAGIQGIWNFTRVDLDVPRHVIVENQRLEQGLMTLSFLMGQARRSDPQDNYAASSASSSPLPDNSDAGDSKE